MTLEQAKQLTVGQIVTVPEDRGDAGYTGPITHISEGVNKNYSGTEYIWVTVRHPNGKSSHVWPSNRIG